MYQKDIENIIGLIANVFPIDKYPSFGICNTGKLMSSDVVHIHLLVGLTGKALFSSPDTPLLVRSVKSYQIRGAELLYIRGAVFTGTGAVVVGAGVLMAAVVVGAGVVGAVVV